jgi:endonuclease/exonuclease/phosphatase family metal-dependent hydrolase
MQTEGTPMRHLILLLLATSLAAQAREVSFMTYNVENIFDTQHDQGKNDWTYLPKAFKDTSSEAQAYCQAEANPEWKRDCFEMDWNDEVLEVKARNIGRMIREVNGGRGPDILVVQEVENIHALRTLNRLGLRGLGYTTEVLLEGPDKRGIDVGLLSRFPLTEAKAHLVNNRTRPILEASLRVGDKVLSVFVNHWPSQSNPSSDRVDAARVLYNAATGAVEEGRAVIAAGDFNTLPNENPNGIKEFLMNPRRALVFKDAVTEIKALGGAIAEGTHWYRAQWSFLDHIFVLERSMDDGLVDPHWSSVSVVKPEFALEDRRWNNGGQSTVHRVPYRFDANGKRGFADHLPLTMKFDL